MLGGTVSRTADDSWDLASSVGATATMVAAARALATRDPDPLIDDPWAEPLVRAVGIDFFTKLVDGALTAPGDRLQETAAMMTAHMAVRTRFFDDFFLDAARAGVRQAVILASGLDSRAYRLPWPTGTVVFEIDQPRVLEAKTATMADLGATATCDRRAVAVDLRDDWPAALQAAGFDPDLPTAWSAEGLLVYLPPEAQDRLFDDVTALSAAGSRLATEYHPDGGSAMAGRSEALRELWREHGFDLDFANLVFQGERSPVADYLAAREWAVSARTRPEVFAAYGRTYDVPDDFAPMRASLAIVATKNHATNDQENP
jgi:methyltransferase (TIGR00027 family)